MKPRDINLFALETVVEIPGVEDYEKVTIKRISDAGVTVNGQKCGNNIVISGRTPAILWVEKEKIIEENKIMTTENTINVNNEAVNETASNRAKRGSIKAKMAAIQVPANPFTVKQLAELNDIPVNYANLWVKSNAKLAGSVEKVEGQRGRVASLYSV